MQKIKILVDSGSDMPREYCELYGISVVPLNLQIEGRTVLDDDNLDAAKYCEYLKVAPEVPKSAQPSPQAFLDQYRANADCDHIIVITMSSKASGTHQSAVMARDLFEEENTSCRVHVVDSTSTSFAITMLALHAARLIKEGKSAAEIISSLAEHIPHTGTYYLIDDISFLIRRPYFLHQRRNRQPHEYQAHRLRQKRRSHSPLQRAGLPKRHCQDGKSL